MAKGKKKILIAEDEIPLQHAFELKLTHAGFEVVSVGNGKDFLKELEKGGTDLAILDLMMPEMNGFQVLEEMGKGGHKIPVIVVSNLAQEEDEKKAKALGASEFFIKSDTPIADIVTFVEKQLAK